MILGRMKWLKTLFHFALLLSLVPISFAAAPAAPASTQSATQQYLSFNFQNISLRSLLQLIASHSGLNLIVSDSVKGETSITLKSVTWQQALDIVLKANALGERQYGNVLMIGPVEELASNEVKQLQAQQQLADLSPLSSAMIRINYANATDIAGVIKGQSSSLLSPRGQIGVDSRTNSIWLRDTKTNIVQVRKFIKQLDTPVRQVLIEARIVTIETDYAKNLGVQMGVTEGRHLSGTLVGANQLAQGVPASGVPVPERLNFNLPATGVLQQPNAGSIALALFRIGGSYLDLELSALEGQQHAAVISNPRVITSNQQKAHIQTGQEIPYQEATSSGATSVTFKNAVLSLEITPQITPDNHIVLTVGVTRDRAAGPATQNFPPAIDTEEVQSNVFLKDGETVVIGGIYQEDDQHTFVRIPFFGSLPLIGPLFRNNAISDKKTELMVFITPKIIDAYAKPVMNKEERRLERLSRSSVISKVKNIMPNK